MHNVRLNASLATEIDRIAAERGESASEVARMLLSYGAEVERRLEAQKLMQHYTSGKLGSDIAGRVVISAEFVPYTWSEVAEIQEDIASRGEAGRLPTWDDLTP